MKTRQARKIENKWNAKLADLASYVCKPSYLAKYKAAQPVLRRIEKRKRTARSDGRIVIGQETVMVRSGDSQAHVQRKVDEACKRTTLDNCAHCFTVWNETDLAITINLGQMEVA